MASKSIKQLVSEARMHITNLSPAEAQAALESGNARFIDLRESEEIRRNGKIPAAVHAPRGMLEFYADPASPYHLPEFDPQQELILYCAGGGRSALATKTLQEMGFEKVAHLDGGFKAWEEAGLPVQNDS